VRSQPEEVVERGYSDRDQRQREMGEVELV
jgi:hypothetical protein